MGIEPNIALFKFSIHLPCHVVDEHSPAFGSNAIHPFFKIFDAHAKLTLPYGRRFCFFYRKYRLLGIWIPSGRNLDERRIVKPCLELSDHDTAVPGKRTVDCFFKRLVAVSFKLPALGGIGRIIIIELQRRNSRNAQGHQDKRQ
ncbi:hypothetical protein D3C86_1300890 [compost metagenome]